MHRAAYAARGLDWSYDAFEVTEADLPRFVDGLDRTWRGLSLTMPLKRSVVPLLDEMSWRVEQAEAANTVILQDGRRTGHNTDVAGVAEAIRERGTRPLGSAVILGGGATASSALLALADLGVAEVTLVVRDEVRARETQEAAARHPDTPTVRVRDFAAPAQRADILVSTIPAVAQTESVLALAAHVPVVFDVVYDPWPTPLASFARSRGLDLVSGLDLLLHQAFEQFRLMTGLDDVPRDQMRAAAVRAVHSR